MFHNNYLIIRNLIFGDKKKEIKIKQSKINNCLEIKEQLDKCLEKNNCNCIFIKNAYENCIKTNLKK